MINKNNEYRLLVTFFVLIGFHKKKSSIKHSGNQSHICGFYLQGIAYYGICI